MNRNILHLLRCPACGNQLDLQAFSGRGERIMDGILKDSNGHAFPIVGGIPRMLPSAMEAYHDWRQQWGEQLVGTSSCVRFEAQETATVASFGFQWNWDNRPRSDEDRSEERRVG